MRQWTKSACVVIAWSILAVAVALVSCRGPENPAQANISIASSTQVTLASAPAALMSVTTAPAAAPVVSWTVRPGDTLSSVAANLAVPGGWQALYHANRRAVGPDPDVIRPGTVLSVPGEQKPARYTVAPGDTLTGIAAALALPGGWQALYRANRQVIGADPNAIRPGTVLAWPRPAAAKQPSAPVGAPAGAGAGHAQAAPPSPPAGRPPIRARAVPAGGTITDTGMAANGIMPSWLKVTLLAAALLATIAFITEPAAVILGRRRRAAPAARTSKSPAPVREPGIFPAGAVRNPSARNGRVPSAGQDDRVRRAMAKAARIVHADYERLIVTYSVSDDTVYLLTPPGEDPRAVLRAARLVVPEDTYEELAGHLGVPSGWWTE